MKSNHCSVLTAQRAFPFRMDYRSMNRSNFYNWNTEYSHCTSTVHDTYTTAYMGPVVRMN